MPSFVTLTELRNEVRSLADLENSSFVVDSTGSTYTLDSHINNSLRELYDLLVDRHKDYFLAYDSFTLSSNQNYYALPTRFYKMRRVRAGTDSTNPYFLRPINLNIQDAYTSQNLPGERITLEYIPSFRPLTDTDKTFTDSEVDISTDTITLTGHSMVTGDTFELTNSGGALPTGLSTSTTYYAVVTTKNAFQVATNLDNAIKGTVIDITAAAGGGTHTLDGDFDQFDSVNGYHMYAVWDSVIKMKIRGEEGIQEALVEREKEKNRIIGSSSIRNSGYPKAVWDVNLVHDRFQRQYGENLGWALSGNHILVINTSHTGEL